MCVNGSPSMFMGSVRVEALKEGRERHVSDKRVDDIPVCHHSHPRTDTQTHRQAWRLGASLRLYLALTPPSPHKKHPRRRRCSLVDHVDPVLTP